MPCRAKAADSWPPCGLRSKPLASNFLKVTQSPGERRHPHRLNQADRGGDPRNSCVSLARPSGRDAMRRRAFIAGLGGAAAWPMVATACSKSK